MICGYREMVRWEFGDLGIWGDGNGNIQFKCGKAYSLLAQSKI